MIACSVLADAIKGIWCRAALAEAMLRRSAMSRSPAAKKVRRT